MEDSSIRGNKRVCTSHVETEPQYVSAWLRMMNKLRVQDHLETTMKLAVGLAIPLMNLFMKVLAMLMRVADMEEIDTLHVMMNQMVVEKKQQEKGFKLTKERLNMTKEPAIPVRKKSSVGSFSVVTAETLDTLMSHQSQDSHPCYPATAASSNQNVQHKEIKADQCYCGLKPVKYTCRKQGHNYLRQFYRCPKEPQSQHQCHFFQWIQETKGEEYERIYASSPTIKKHQDTSKKSEKHSVIDLSSCEEPEEISPGQFQHHQVRGSPRGSTSPPPRAPTCPHQWNRRGTNAYIKMRTCMLCGLQEITNRRNEAVTQRWVDISTTKKSGRPRAVSP
eukprot:s58_g6.t1